jgi:cytochrome c553
MAPLATARAADAQAGRKKARVCQTCHGIDGASRLAEAPNLSGQVETYLVKALHDFREGRRSNEMMTIVVQPLSDEDIADLAAWYASVAITVTPPP